MVNNKQDPGIGEEDISSGLMDTVKGQLDDKFGFSLANVDRQMVTELTGLYQQALKENGLGEGIEARATLNLLGFNKSFSFSWDPGILLSPDLVLWLQGQTAEIRGRILYYYSVLMILYRETVRRLETMVEEGVEGLIETLDDFRTDPIDTTLSFLR